MAREPRKPEWERAGFASERLWLERRLADYRAAALDVIAAADNTYGRSWRTWAKSVSTSPGTKRLALALEQLERVTERALADAAREPEGEGGRNL